MYVENTIASLSKESSISGLKGFSCVAFTVSLFCNYLLKDCVQNDGNGEIWYFDWYDVIIVDITEHGSQILISSNNYKLN